MNKKRILYVAGAAKGGSAYSLFHMIQGLDRNQYEPMVVFFSKAGSHIERRMQESGAKITFLATEISAPASASAVAPASQPANRDIGHWLEGQLGKRAKQIYHLFRAHYKYLREDRPRAQALVRYIRDNDIDLVHTNNDLRAAKPAIKAARLTRVPVVCHARGFTQYDPHDLIFARSVDLMVYISRAVGQDHQRQGVSAAGIVVHNVVDLNEFPSELTSAETAQAVRAEFGWGRDTPIVAVVGRLDWWKGHETFLQALATATDRVPGLKALIIGAPVDSVDGQQYYQTLQSMTKSLHLKNTVIYTGFRSDIPRLMSASDVIVLSSSTPEPFGRVVIEGMAAGRPVVATAAGGVLDIIQDGTDGRLVPIRNADAMSKAITELILDPQEAKRMGRAARQRAEQSFSLSRQVETIQKVYSTILSTPRRDRANIRWQDIVDTPSIGPRLQQ